MSAQMAAGWSADLAAAVLARLDLVDQVATGVRRRGAAELARIRGEMAELVEGWRRLLKLHQADEHGRCPRCRGWVRRRRWPCAVWTTAHEHLITSAATALVPAASDRRALVPYPRETGAPSPAGRAPTSARPGTFVVFARRSPGGAR